MVNKISEHTSLNSQQILFEFMILLKDIETIEIIGNLSMNISFKNKTCKVVIIHNTV